MPDDLLDVDVFTEVTESSWLDRAGSSLAGVLVGIVLFFGSFWVLVWNEGRAVDAINALNAGARLVVPVAADTVNPANEGKLVHVSGQVTVSGSVEDPVFHVGGNGLLRVLREVEMYQWREKEESKTDSSLGGKETTTTTYRYLKEWSSTPINSREFKRPEGHVNPAMAYKGATFDARTAKIGAFALDPAHVRRVEAFEALPPPAAPDAVKLPDGFRWVGEQIYRGASPDQPQIGDLRISFRAVPVQTISVVAVQTGNGFTAYSGKNGYEIDLVRAGAHNADAMFKQAQSEENVFTWIMRAVGFFMMLIGVVLVTGPIGWLVSFIPFLESIVNAAAFGLAFIVSVPLTLVTIALSWLAFRPLIGGGLLVAAVLLAIGIRRLVPQRSKPAPQRSGGGVMGAPS